MRHTDFVYPTRGLVGFAHTARGVRDASQFAGYQADFLGLGRGLFRFNQALD